MQPPQEERGRPLAPADFVHPPRLCFIGVEFMTMVPTFSAREWAANQPFVQPSDVHAFVEGYLKAGLPE